MRSLVGMATECLVVDTGGDHQGSASFPIKFSGFQGGLKGLNEAPKRGLASNSCEEQKVSIRETDSP